MNADDATFCANCGANLRETSESVAPLTGAQTGGGMGAKMSGAFNEGLALIRDPIGYMTKNKGNSVPLNSLMINYVAMLALIPLVGRIIGDAIFYHGGELGYAIAGSIVAYILDLISVFVVGIVIWKLAPTFSTATDQSKSTLMAAYVYTPIFFIGILNIIPVLGYLAILGLLYGIYILYKGLPILVGTPKDKTVGYVVAVLVVSFIIVFIIGLIIGGFDAAVHM